MPRPDPPRVTVAGIEALSGEGLELRMLVKVRVQNPNDMAIDYDGVSMKLDVQGRTVATGVSDERGTLPRYGESVIGVRVSIQMLDLARQALGMLKDGGTRPLHYTLEGKVGTGMFGDIRFRSQGDLPALANPAENPL